MNKYTRFSFSFLCALLIFSGVIGCYNVQKNNIPAFTPEEEYKTPPAIVVEYNYILNDNTKRIHLPSCEYVEKIYDNNKRETNEDISILIDCGYKPCKVCNP